MAIPFTEQELREMALAAEFAELVRDEELRKLYYQYVAGALDVAQLAIDDAIRGQLIRALKTSADPKAIEAAHRLADREVKRITGNIAQAELNKIGAKIAEGIELGKGPREIARQLTEVKGLDANRAARYEKYKAYLEQSDRSDAEIERMLETFYRKELKARRETIARTEQRMANGEAQRLQAESRGQKFKAWITSGDERVSDECAGNEAQGWIDIDEEFSSGHDTQPAHPNCRCTVTYRTAPPNEFAQERAEQRAEQTAAAKGATQ